MIRREVDDLGDVLTAKVIAQTSPPTYDEIKAAVKQEIDQSLTEQSRRMYIVGPDQPA